MSEYSALARRYVYSSFFLLLVGYLFPALALLMTDVISNPQVFFISLGFLILCTAISMGINFITDRYIFDIKALQKQETSKFRQRFLKRHQHLLHIYQATDFLSIMNLLLCPVVFYYVSTLYGS
ncbi:hypothetical protein LG198_03435 [Methylobacillus arboreus]|uniref:hypothetical protein n=1 Tax=Methylobacillus arboreus TaxID=755170 RepID=UPI001E654DF2|nr:hypothetical protein [Methylobacillus arboreus]MCB5189784.1 hypothetical protein [Methylobacillus arboreus]